MESVADPEPVAAADDRVSAAEGLDAEFPAAPAVVAAAADPDGALDGDPGEDGGAVVVEGAGSIEDD